VSKATDRPNLLYIHSDQHCPFVTGCYGDPLVRTPNLDRLAASGAVMDAAYCPSPICVPSRMSMLTGRHPFQNRAWTNRHMLDSSIPTLAHALGAAGYRPRLVGRMHSIGPDQLHGYAERYVGDHSPNFVGGHPAVDRGSLNGTAGPQHVSLERSGAGQSGYEVHDEEVTEVTVDLLDRIGAERRRSGAGGGKAPEPFCLTAGFMLPHPPYVARKDDFALYEGRVTPPGKPELAAGAAPEYLEWWREDRGLMQAAAGESLRARAAYWGLVTSLDRMIGRILRALEENGLEENTLVVYTSDHGDMLGEHGLWWKHTFYEESARVPLILSWKDRISAGARCTRVVSALDGTATILDALGAPALPGAAGRSLLPLLEGDGEGGAAGSGATGGSSGGPVEWTDEAFSEYCSDEEWSPAGGCYQRMIRRDQWKLCYYHGDRMQLFDLKEDPQELVNRAEDPACRGILSDLRARLLEEWDPEQVTRTMRAKREEQELLTAWAENTAPSEGFRWDMRPEMFHLDEPA